MKEMRWRNTISTFIPVESAGSFGDGRCCHPSGYLQIDGIRLPADGATSSRLRHAPQATAPVPTGLVALGLPPSLSPKSLRKFHQTNRVNVIRCWPIGVGEIRPQLFPFLAPNGLSRWSPEENHLQQSANRVAAIHMVRPYSEAILCLSPSMKPVGASGAITATIVEPEPVMKALSTPGC